MNKLIEAYADVDCLFDYRRALIQKFITKDMAGLPTNPTEEEEAFHNERRRMEGDKLWDLYIAKNYTERRMDTFEYPFIKFNKDTLSELVKERSIKDWAFGYYPTRFVTQFLQVVIDQEQLTEAPLAIKGVVLTVNTFPYAFDDALNADLIAHCKQRFSGRVDVKVISSDTRSATVGYYKQFNYVFKYDLLLSADYKALFDSVGSPPIPNTTFIVPDLLVKEDDAFEGSIGDRIFACSLAAASVFKIVPINRSFYDYE